MSVLLFQLNLLENVKQRNMYIPIYFFFLQMNNPTEYLKLLVKYGRLEEAFHLSKSYFSENLLNKSEQLMMIPISYIDVLLYEMKSREIYSKV